MKNLIITIAIILTVSACSQKEKTIAPYWLKDYQSTYEKDPLKASHQWFKDAGMGMFVHLNLASLCERGKDDYSLWKKGIAPDRLLDYVGISREEYENAEDKDLILYNKYTLDNFDPEKICQLALKAKMKYIVFTTHHLGGCYNFKTSLSEFNSLNSPCQRDLAGEMAKACKKHGIALMMYVPPQISLTIEGHYQHNQTYLTELLTQYGDLAGIWFDGIGGFYKQPEDYLHLDKLHALVKQHQPHTLVSFKEGAIGDEDFLSPEHFMLPFDYKWDNDSINKRFKIRVDRWAEHNNDRWNSTMQYKLREINTVMQKCKGREDAHVGGGWINDESATHYTADEVYGWLAYSRYTGSNMLMNIGPRKDGSIHPDDEKALIGVGKLVEAKGWPELHNTPKPKP